MRKILLSMAAMTLSIVSWAQSDKRPEILVLGAYHMANPGADAFNVKADDVLAPKRQQEIAQFVQVLRKFQPTKIAIEEDVTSHETETEYFGYLAGKYTLDRGEGDQIGYRLAKELGLRAVYPVDVEGDFPLDHMSSWAKANGRADKLDALMANMGAQVKEEAAFLQSHTVLEMFENLNSDAAAAKGIAAYYACVPFGKPGDYAGPDLLAAWYQRNIRIYHNILNLIDSPNDRILVIFGAGHLGWLRQNIANDPTVRLRKLAEFTREQ